VHVLRLERRPGRRVLPSVWQSPGQDFLARELEVRKDPTPEWVQRCLRPPIDMDFSWQPDRAWTTGLADSVDLRRRTLRPYCSPITIVTSIGLTLSTMAASARPTPIAVPTAVRRALEQYKRPGLSSGDVLLEFMEEFPPEEFLREVERRLRAEKRVPLDQVHRDAGL
jgi:hypothetical protein